MALTRTTLAAAATANTTRFNVTSATGATVGGFIRVNNEFAVIVAISGTAIDVRSRGDQGTLAQAHDLLAPVTFGLATDLPELGTAQQIQQPLLDWDIVSVGQNGVVPAPKRNTLYIMNKATALASTTFADPTAAQDGLIVRFVNATDAAHVITTVSVHDGTTGAHTTCTFAAYIGASLTLQAVQADWMVIANNNCTIT